MPTPAADDAWLDGLADLDVRQLEAHLAALRTEADVVQRRLHTVELLLARAAGAPREAAPARPAPPAPEAGAGLPPEDTRAPVTFQTQSDTRRASWKTEAVLTLLQGEPDRMLTAREVRAELQAAGSLVADEGTPTALLLRRLAGRGQVAVQDGRYGHLPPTPALHGSHAV
jgi:hypothetical protein